MRSTASCNSNASASSTDARLGLGVCFVCVQVHLRESAGDEKEPADNAWAQEHDRVVAARVSPNGAKPLFSASTQAAYEKGVAAADAKAASMAGKDDKEKAEKAGAPVPIPGTGGVVFGDDVLFGGEPNSVLNT
jgi:hypothetical protein